MEINQTNKKKEIILNPLSTKGTEKIITKGQILIENNNNKDSDFDKLLQDIRDDIPDGNKTSK